MTIAKLTTTNHSRDIVGLTYVYPVLSRRSGGLSIGINLNPNNACNWRCIYCQVPNLQRGSAPKIDLDQLESELREFLQDVLEGNFFDRFEVKPECRQICDIALSGNGEPTTAREFEGVIERLTKTIRDYRLDGTINVVLITNGSMIHKMHIQRALEQISTLGGEIWFKLDSATDKGLKQINNAGYTIANAARNLEIASRLCPTWLQTVAFALDGSPMSKIDQIEYIEFLKNLVMNQVPLKGVLLYGLARPSLQPEASRLSELPCESLEALASKIQDCGISVKVSC